MTTISSLEEAKRYFLSFIREKILNTRKDGYAYFIETELRKFCVCFKREYYRNFQFHFPKVDKVGYGQVANKKLLQKCVDREYMYVAVMPDGKIYWIDPNEWMDYYEKYKTDVPHLPDEIAIPLKFFFRFTG